MTTKFLLFAPILAIISGLLVLTGWAFDILLLKSILSIWVSMKANTAFCFVLIGIAMLPAALPKISNSNFLKFGQLSGLLAGLIGLLTVSEYLFDWNLGIDQWLFHDAENAVGTSHLGRMALETALCFFFLSIALWMNCVLNKHYAAVLICIGFIVLTFALSAIVTYLDPNVNLFGWFSFTIMAMHTSILFMLLGIAVITIGWQRSNDLLSENSSFQHNCIKLDIGMAAIILVVIIPVLIVLVHLRQVAENKTVVVTQNVVQVLDMSIEVMIDKIALAVRANANEISREIALNGMDFQTISQHFKEQTSLLPEADYLYSFNEYGDVIYNTEALLKPININDREHFITLRDTKNSNLITMTTVVSRFSNKWILLIACRINNPDGSFGGIVSAAILLDKINGIFSRIQLNTHDFITLRDANLGLIASFPSPKTANLVIGSKNLSIPFVNALKANAYEGTYISGVTSIDNISRIHSYRKNAKYGFTINVGISIQSLLTEWHKQAWSIVGLVIVFIITLLAFSRMIKRAWLRQEQDVNALKISEQSLHEASKIAQLGNYTYDLQTDLWTSSNILDEIFGIDATYVRTSETWLALVVSESRSEMQTYLNTLIEQNLPFNKEYKIVHFNDGQERWVHGKGKLQLDEQGKPLSLIGTIQDITEQKLTEIEIKTLNSNLEMRVHQRTYELETANQSLIVAKAAAEKANIAKSTFIATMSHELRTPLNAILGFSELMSLDASATQKQKETLAIINRSGAHLLGMINDVLDISKIEAGRLELDIHALDLISLLNDVGEMINVRAAAKQLDFRLELAPDITQFIKADSGKLRQVLINLLGNAIKFTAKGSVALRAKSKALILTLEVIDSGMGISTDKQSELFKPFVQLTQNNIDAQGTGLGLVISKSLVELMGGQISVSSEFGVGSTFKIELPITLADANDVITDNDAKTVKSLAPNQPAWRLLVVDDNAENRLLLVSMLTEIGFEVREAANGFEAIREFEQWQPHLIWMDMRMPVMNGFEATTKIRQLKGGNEVKIIAVTASVFKEQHQHVFDSGCDAVLHKPIHVSEVFAALVKHLGVKFTYYETTVVMLPALKVTPKMLAQLPLELRKQLYEAALQLDMEEVDNVIKQIRVFSAEVGNGLDKLAQSYQFEEITHLIETVTH